MNDEIDETLPRDSYELIRFLDKAYPPECIGRGESLESAHRRAGVRELIDELIDMMNTEIAEASAPNEVEA